MNKLLLGILTLAFTLSTGITTADVEVKEWEKKNFATLDTDSQWFFKYN